MFHVSSNDPLRSHAEVSELQLKYDCFVVQLSSVNLEGDTWRSLVRGCGTEITSLRASLATFKDVFKLLEGTIRLTQKDKESIAFERDACNTKVGRLQDWKHLWFKMGVASYYKYFFVYFSNFHSYILSYQTTMNYTLISLTELK